MTPVNAFDAANWPDRSAENLLVRLANAAIQAAKPAACIPSAVAQVFPAPPAGRTLVFGAGKASAQMAAAFEEAYPWPVEGFVVTRTGFGCENRSVQVMEASHPLPDASSANAGRALLEAMGTTTRDDRVVFLLSGGCSSLIFTPVPGLEHNQVWRLLSRLLDSGMPVDAINVIRQTLSLTGGGKLAAACHGHLTTLAISDVAGDRPEDIGSAPTTYPTRITGEILKQLKQLLPDTDSGILAFLQQSQTCQHARVQLAADAFHIVASSRMAIRCAADLAQRNNMGEITCIQDVTGDVAFVVEHHTALAEKLAQSGKPALILSGGELTVSVNPKSLPGAKGGPNQEYALRLCRAVHQKGIRATILSIDTDGIDGRGDAAGALISTDMYKDLLRQDIDVDRLLKGNESYRALDAISALLRPGPTGTNVNDFRAVLLSGVQ